MIDSLLYQLARAVVALIQALPLNWVAHLGRAGGATAYWVDGRHRRAALDNLTLCFGGEKSPLELRRLARENFRRIGENFACAVKTAGMPQEQLSRHLQIVGLKKILPADGAEPPHGLIMAVGHFGNFEIYARLGHSIPWYQGATTYRGLRQPAINKLLLSLRKQSGCLYFERRTEGEKLKAALRKKNLVLGLLADQSSGSGGARLRFFGRECATSTAPAVFALRYRMPLHTTICFRTGVGRWRVEIGDEIPTRIGNSPRAVATIMQEVNDALEVAVRRDPANWFWVHNRWKLRRDPNGAKTEDAPERESEPAPTHAQPE